MEKKFNPAPLGLAGFATTTILLSLGNAGILAVNDVVMAMAVFYGGIAQIVAGIFEGKENNTFGFVAFTSYGCFWLTFVTIVMTSHYGLMPANGSTLGVYLLLWGILTLGLFIGTLSGKMIGKLVFGTLTITFFLLSLGEFGVPNFGMYGGYMGVICGILAFYEAIAIVANEKSGKELFPM